MSGIKLLVIILLTTFGLGSNIHAQVIKSFVQRSSYATPNRLIYNIRGDYTMIGNTNLTLQSYADDKNNSNNVMQYVDVDSDDSTFNSSSATLEFSTENGAIPQCSNIIYAGLYWTGRASNTSNSPESFTVTKGGITKTLNKRKVLLKGPGQADYTEQEANPGNIHYPNGTQGNMYSAYVEVTDYVKANGLGEYTLADLAVTEGNGGNTGYYGGWGMIVVYENSKMKWRDVTVYDGHAYVVGNTSIEYELPVSGFRTAQAGAINMKLGMMAGEGDVGISGDFFKIRNHQNTAWVDLVHSGNSTTNFFNGSVNTGGNPRNPTLQNNTGLDIAMFNIDNPGNSVVTNDQQSTRFQYGSTQDTYTIFCIAMAVDAYVPDVEAIVSTEYINGVPVGGAPLSADPGDTIEYLVQIKNLGTEAIDSATFVIPMPYTANYLDSSATSNINFTPLPSPDSAYFDPTVGLTGSVVWDFGTLPMPPVGFPDSVLAELSFKFIVTTDCYTLMNPDCPLHVTLAGGVSSGIGVISGTPFTNKPFIQGYEQVGLCVGEPITDPIQIGIDPADYIADNCQGLPINRNFVFCEYESATIPLSEIAPSFPLGLRFYNTNNVTPTSIEYTDNNPFPATMGKTTYFAIPDGANQCYYTFTITVSNIKSLPTKTGDVNYCLNDVAVPLEAIPSDSTFVLHYYTSLVDSIPDSTIIPSTSVAGVTTYYVAEGEPISGGGCISSNRLPIVVSVYDLNASITSQTNVLCKGASTGTASVNVSGGSGSHTYSWSTLPVQTTATATALAAGGYTVTVTDSIGCTAQDTVTITEPAVVLDVNIISQTNLLCKGDNNGSATAAGIGGSGTYSYTWNTVPSQHDSTAINLSAGTYEVIVLDANGCPDSAKTSVTITEPTSGLDVNIVSQTNVLCKGDSTGSVTVVATGGSGSYSYSWNTIPTQIGPTATGLPAGIYEVSVLDSNGCPNPAKKSVTITEPASALDANIVAKTDVLCKGDNTGSATVLATGGSGGYDYTWNTIPSQTTAIATGLIAGSYTVTVKDINGCSDSIVQSVTITEPDLALDLNIISQTNVLCKGDSTGSATVAGVGGSGAYIYTWNTIPPQTGPTATGLIAGTYVVIVKDQNGCTDSVLKTITITEPTMALDAAIVSQNNIACHGDQNGSARVEGSGGSGKYFYTWNTDPEQVGPTAFGLYAGTYMVTVQDQNGCTDSIVKSVTITEPSAALELSLVSKTDVLCKGDSTGSITVLVTGGSGGYDYVWKTNPAQPVQTTPTAIGLKAGSQVIMVTDTNGCDQVESLTILITEPENDLSATIDVQNVTCNGENSGTATVIASGGSGSYIYEWNTSPIQTTPTATGLSTGTYVVTISDANGCNRTLTEVAVITEPDGLTLDFDVTNSECSNETGSINLTVIGGTAPFTYNWSNGSTEEDIYNLDAGTYFVNVSDVNNCTASDTTSVTSSTLDISLSSPTHIGGHNLSGYHTEDGIIDLTITGDNTPFTYIWSNGATTEDLINVPAGEYFVVVTDASGCTAYESITLTEPHMLEMPTGISPNKDGYNDLFIVRGLEIYPRNMLTIYNRWGNIVYEYQNYANMWDGVNNKGEPLPNGTYFVILEIAEENITLTNYLDIRK